MASKISNQMNQITETETIDSVWHSLYKIGGVVALISLLLIPIQIVIYIVWPPPNTVAGFFTVFQDNWFRGLVNLDLLYMLSMALVVFIYLPLYAALRKTSQSAMAIALTIGLVSIAIYFVSNTSFEMLSLSNQYAAATTEAQRAVILAAGEAMLTIYQGTASIVYYILGAVATLIVSFVMLRSRVFSRMTAYVGMLAGALMLVPPAFGTVGIILAFASLLPTTVWLVLLAWRFFQLGRTA